MGFLAELFFLEIKSFLGPKQLRDQNPNNGD
jgi:hypothetical protein